MSVPETGSIELLSSSTLALPLEPSSPRPRWAFFDLVEPEKRLSKLARRILSESVEPDALDGEEDLDEGE